MAQDSKKPSGPDLIAGIALAELADGGKLVGHVGDEEVLLVRRGTEVFAVGAQCTHYHGPLVEGLVVDETVRCPWHHACFDLRTGEALRAPALSPVAVLVGRAARRQDLRAGEARAAETAAARQGRGRRPRKDRHRRRRRGRFRRGRATAARGITKAASSCSATTTRRPCDRPNLSKDYLAGNAPEEWVPLRPDRFYSKNAHRPAPQRRT